METAESQFNNLRLKSSNSDTQYQTLADSDRHNQALIATSHFTLFRALFIILSTIPLHLRAVRPCQEVGDHTYLWDSYHGDGGRGDIKVNLITYLLTASPSEDLGAYEPPLRSCHPLAATFAK